MAKEKKICENCGSAMMVYPHGMSKSLARCMAKLARAAKVGEVVHYQKIGLTHSEPNNFQKLKYFGLVEKDGDPTGKGGYWKMTHTGDLFVRGMISVPKKVWTYHGEVVSHSDESVYIVDVTGGWKYRPDYAREALPNE